MPLFKCDQCGCVENTACSGFWHREWDQRDGTGDGRALCSECDPQIGKWHARFEKRPWPENDPNYIDVRSPDWPHGPNPPAPVVAKEAPRVPVKRKPPRGLKRRRRG